MFETAIPKIKTEAMMRPSVKALFRLQIDFLVVLV
jgi:hypothetical protein